MELTKSVLICVERDIMLTALKFRMEKQGYNVVHVKTIKEAKAKIKELDIDLIISDLEIDGKPTADIIKWSKSKNKGKLTPFLVMATLDDDGVVLEKMLKDGVHDFILKPFKPVELYFRINRIVPTLGV